MGDQTRTISELRDVIVRQQELAVELATTLPHYSKLYNHPTFLLSVFMIKRDLTSILIAVEITLGKNCHVGLGMGLNLNELEFYEES